MLSLKEAICYFSCVFTRTISPAKLKFSDVELIVLLGTR